MASQLPPIIVVNAASSAGGTTIARKLQNVLPDVRLLLGVDAFLDALPDWAVRTDVGIRFAADGGIDIAPEYHEREDAWYRMLARLSRDGQPIILDEVLLSGGAGQDRLLRLFGEVPSFWVAVRCDPDVAEAREAKRPDRVTGMARSQAERVHLGVRYDVEVDGGTDSPDDAVDDILAALLRRG
ncbi:chloramphenicol phosphotransferase CPT family protein [Microbacterium sp. GXF7504]